MNETALTIRTSHAVKHGLSIIQSRNDPRQDRRGKIGSARARATTITYLIIHTLAYRYLRHRSKCER